MPISHRFSLPSLLLAGPVFACLAPLAGAMTPEQAFTAWSRCDAGFFRPEVIQALNPNGQLPTDKRQGAMWLVASNGYPEGQRTLDYAAPLSVAGLPVSQYRTMNQDLGIQGVVYDWGFTLQGTLAQVIERLGPLVYAHDHLVAAGTALGRTEIRADGLDWTLFPAPAAMPGRNHAERRLTIAPADAPDRVRVTCSLRGGIAPDILAANRPDLEAAKYPQPSDPAALEKIPLPADTARAVTRWAQSAPDWTPRFRTITVRLLRDLEIVTQTLTADGPLVRTEEQRDPDMVASNTSLAGLITLKSLTNAGLWARSARLRDHLAVQWPAAFDRGATLHVQGDIVQTPDLDGTILHDDTTCKVVGTMPGRSIVESLQETAVQLDCTAADGSRTRYAGLKSLGLFLPLESTDSKGTTQNYLYMELQVSR